MKKVINFFPVILLFIVLLVSCTQNEDRTDAATTDVSISDTAQDIVSDTNSMSPTDTSTNATTQGPNTGAKVKKGKVTTVLMSKSNKHAPMHQDKQGYYSSVEILPAFPGGQDALDKFISNSIEYPQNANENGIEGVVNVQFAVDETGRVSNPKIVGKALGYGLEDEVIKAVSKMPVWTPGAIKGKNVKTYYTLPVNFKIEQ